ncbi:hypothetical protein ACU4GD_05440 [Cupriavidus basilensis]
MRRTLGFDVVLTAYGLTECCGLATVCRLGDTLQTIAENERASARRRGDTLCGRRRQ